ncbi:MAG: dihydrodipicolinate synthase family protein [Deltaproteobacteria bacterium]|nr:dihydrodipicolinate synthase family protein [Deltaproteobacteria bacterium]
MAKRFEGIYPPVITSFTESGDIYEKGIRQVIGYLMSEGVHGFFINGSYGSAVLMTVEERKKVAEIIHGEVNGRLPIITHVGEASTRATIELAKHAEGLGSAAVAAVVPYYYSGANAYDEGQIIRHYADIAASVDVPTFIYNNPRTSCYNLTPELLAGLVKVGVLGMKDSSGSFTLLGEFNQAATQVNPDFTCMSGSVGLLQPAFNIGLKGCIAGTANAFPELVVSLYKALEAHDWEKSRELQTIVIAQRKIQAASGFRPAGCYTFLKLKGIDCGTVRRPWREPNEQETRYMKQEAIKLGLLRG